MHRAECSPRRAIIDRISMRPSSGSRARSKKPESREKVELLPKVRCNRSLEILTAPRAGSAARKKRGGHYVMGGGMCVPVLIRRIVADVSWFPPGRRRGCLRISHEGGIKYRQAECRRDYRFQLNFSNFDQFFGRILKSRFMYISS